MIYKAFWDPENPSDCFTAEELTPRVKYFVTNLSYGTPLVSKKLTKVDKDKPAEELTYPEDNDKIIAFLKDVIDMVEEKYPESSSGIKVRVDGFILAIDDFLAVAMSDALKALFSMTFVFLYLNFHL